MQFSETPNMSEANQDFKVSCLDFFFPPISSY